MVGKTRGMLSVAAAVAWGLAPFAVQAADEPRHDVMFFAAGADCGPGASGEPFTIAVEPKVETVKSAPYSGVGTTEVVTTLADGNRIVRSNKMIYKRDSQGRTRTEYTLSAIGPFTPDQAQTVVTITDPVQGKRYILNSALKRADVFNLNDAGPGKIAAAGGAIGPGKFGTGGGVGFRVKGSSTAVEGGGPPRVSTSTLPPPGAGVAAAGPPVVVMSHSASLPPANVGFIMHYRFAATTDTAASGEDGCKPNTKPLPKPTSLGERIVEGLKVTGTRMEFTIPEGAVGNEQPITVSSEQWFSPDLGVVVQSTHRDPMMGDTNYRLEQISRAEPDASLFTVPADYTQSDVPAGGVFFEQALPAPPPGAAGIRTEKPASR